jgi:acyl carrier protein
MSQNIEKEIILIISEVSGVDEEDVKLDSNLINDLEIDSIKAIEIAVAVEKKYKVSIRDEDIPKIMTPRQIVELTQKLLTEEISK